MLPDYRTSERDPRLHMLDALIDAQPRSERTWTQAPRERKPSTALLTAVEILRESGPMHYQELAHLLTLKLGRLVTGHSIKSSMNSDIRGSRKFGFTRPNPGVYGVQR